MTKYCSPVFESFNLFNNSLKALWLLLQFLKNTFSLCSIPIIFYTFQSSYVSLFGAMCISVFLWRILSESINLSFLSLPSLFAVLKVYNSAASCQHPCHLLKVLHSLPYCFFNSFLFVIFLAEFAQDDNNYEFSLEIYSEIGGKCLAVSK